MGKLSVIWRYNKIKIQKCNHILPSVIYITLPFGWLQKCSLFGSEVLNPETNDKRSRRQKQASMLLCFPSVPKLSLFCNSSKNIPASSKTLKPLSSRWLVGMPQNIPQTINSAQQLPRPLKHRWKPTYTECQWGLRQHVAAGTGTHFKHFCTTSLTWQEV